jgi:hypothetical protein
MLKLLLLLNRLRLQSIDVTLLLRMEEENLSQGRQRWRMCVKGKNIVLK